MSVLRATDYRRMTWKNGGGETAEIAVFPEGADLDSFDWRISMAHVASDGPFSFFHGVKRTLAIVSGAGIFLDTAGTTHRLIPDAGPVSFSGDIAASACLIDGPVVDFNIMTRRKTFEHEVQRIVVAGEIEVQARGDLSALFCGVGRLRIDRDGQSEVLAAGDCLIKAKPPGPFVLRGEGIAYSVILRRRI